jgi:hypothetical protein
MNFDSIKLILCPVGELQQSMDNTNSQENLTLRLFPAVHLNTFNMFADAVRETLSVNDVNGLFFREPRDAERCALAVDEKGTLETVSTDGEVRVVLSAQDPPRSIRVAPTTFCNMQVPYTTDKISISVAYSYLKEITRGIQPGELKLHYEYLVCLSVAGATMQRLQLTLTSQERCRGKPATLGRPAPSSTMCSWWTPRHPDLSQAQVPRSNAESAR